MDIKENNDIDLTGVIVAKNVPTERPPVVGIKAPKFNDDVNKPVYFNLAGQITTEATITQLIDSKFPQVKFPKPLLSIKVLFLHPS